MQKYEHISSDLELEVRQGYSDNLPNLIVLKKWLSDAIGQKVIHNEDLYSYKVRIKTIASLLGKLNDKVGTEKKMLCDGRTTEDKCKWIHINSYLKLLDLIDDIVGARVITHVNSALPSLHDGILKSTDLFKIKNITTHEFEERPSFGALTHGNCPTEQRKNYNGYVGIHYIIEPITIDHCWKQEPYIFNKFELQIRSLLQETWGEIQHNAIYKGRMPESQKQEQGKRFARAADLLLSMDGMLSDLVLDNSETIQMVLVKT